MNGGKQKPPDLTSPEFEERKQRFGFNSLTPAMLSTCVCGESPIVTAEPGAGYRAEHRCELLAVTISTQSYRTIERGKVARDWNHFVRSLLNLAQHGRKVPGS